MIKLFERNSTKITISEFYENHERNKYNYDVPYQRGADVWDEDKKSFLIDSILKNYPIPPVFMRPNVDTASGKTVYDIVDGKQRLNAIVAFIENRIPLTSYFFEDQIFLGGATEIENSISGLHFDEIKSNSLFSEYVRQFWTYSINVDYLYEEDTVLISNIFDRLNRNGEPLKFQELRNAQYFASPLLKAIKNLAANEYWKARSERMKIERMEDEEFISELFFLTAENTFFDSSPQVLDDLYEKYSKKDEKCIEDIVTDFNWITEFILQLGIDYDVLKKLNWTTHLYGLYSVSWYCVKNSINADDIKEQIIEMYSDYFSKRGEELTGALAAYKVSCSSRTRSKEQRKKRLEAILEYCGKNIGPLD